MFAGRSVLIIETEYLIGLAVQDALQGHDAAEILLTANPADVWSLRERWPELAMAVIEVELGADDLRDAAQALRAAGVPVLGISADTRLADGVADLPGVPILIKPVPDADLRRAVEALLAKSHDSRT